MPPIGSYRADRPSTRTGSNTLHNRSTCGLEECTTGPPARMGPARSGQDPQYSRLDGPTPEGGRRSEEHTSELQSRQYLVCRLLLENLIKRPKEGKPAESTA